MIDKATAREFSGYGLCRLDIGTIYPEPRGVASVWTSGGGSHVQIRNCETVEVQLALAKIAVVLTAPTPRPRREPQSPVPRTGPKPTT